MHAQPAPDDNRLLRSIPPARVALIERIVAAAGRAVAADFVRAYFHGVGDEDLKERPPAALASAASAHLALGARRLPGRTLVRIFDPEPARDGFASPHTLVLVVTDDMPFLVDSLGLVFQRAEVGVHLIVHPVLDARRDGRGRLLGFDRGAGRAFSESWQLYEIDRQTDPARIGQLRAQLESTLVDVRLAVSDWSAMREASRSLVARLEQSPPPLPAVEVGEARQLLAWMEDEHFVFLGYRAYRLERGASTDRLLPERGGLGILRRRPARGARATLLRGERRERARAPELLVLTKANSRATVHRGDYLDYVGVKIFDARGRVTGEHRFLGLWTASAYHRSPRDIPVLRRKVQQVIEYFGLDPQGHDGKAALHVLETFPRDELFQASVADLIRIVRGVVNLYERRTVRLLARRDAFRRFYSCLVYVPRDRYNTEVRHRIEAIVCDGFGGRIAASDVQISGASHARVHVVVRTEGVAAQVDFAEIEGRIAEAALTWSDRLREALIAVHGEAAGLALATEYRRSFPLAYQDDVAPAEALEDLGELEALRAAPAGLRLRLRRARRGQAARVHLKLTKLGDPVPISDLLPMLENFGLRVIAERPYEIAWPGDGNAWIQDFELEQRDGRSVELGREADFREAFLAAWTGQIENDGFNRLLLGAGLTARQVVILRACCRYLLQTGVPFSQASMERALAAHAGVASRLVQLFEIRFDPQRQPPRGGHNRRRPAADPGARIATQIRAALEAVDSIDEDRILRGYLGLIEAMLRTNHYQRDEAGQRRPYLSFKLDPARIPELPLPRPKFEIFVYSPRVEGVHLRMGFVARGGIRWSDRREDFRTEILGLMKAQNVKNTVIVPVGAKGGFVPKRLPAGSREEIQAEVVACYQDFIRGLLDLTDNIVGSRIVPPAQVVRRDGDDAYLVVAADKGTATFSDIANGISAAYGFWLGDAFASGGSAGYDHKKMGITARGAWECVKRHFRELGRDIQSEGFTVAGIGDMSGDVFGNGMLLSRHIRLLAAFDHRHIFLDPSPDAAVSFAERARLFALPRSSWDDYDRRRLSRGGAVFPRSAKSVQLSPEARALLGLETPAATPNELIRAILRMPVDLLWNGGIGTWVKASRESNADVGDRGNDALRVDAVDLRARVVGEGGNLGFSQRGRVEYALAGGRINTDFIDNSAGVNTSDVEVNIKILLTPQVAAGRLRAAERNRLLARMTGAVAAHVLRNNYLQSQAISVLELRSGERLAEYHNLIRTLERAGELNRALEYLPADDELAERRQRGAGLTRPELAVLLAYGKIWLNEHLLRSDVPEDPYLSAELERYFPEPVRQRFRAAIGRHRLRREIIATAITNSLVNRMGPTFVARAQEETGADPAQVARAYTAAREIFEIRDLWTQIEALDNRVPAELQYSAAFETARLLRHATYRLLDAQPSGLQVETAVARYRSGARELARSIASVLDGAERERYESLRSQQEARGLPAAIAAQVASLEPLNRSLDLVELAAEHQVRVGDAARAYFELGARIGLDWLHAQIERLPVEGPWQLVARTGLRDGALRVHRRLAEHVLAAARRGTPGEQVAAWLAAGGEPLAHWLRTLTDMRAAGATDFATLTVGLEAVRKLAAH